MSIFLAAIRGNIGSGDIFQFGFALQSDDTVESAVTNVGTAVADFVGDGPDIWTPTTTFEEVVLSEINEATGDVIASAMDGIGVAGTSVSPTLPSEVAMCVGIKPVAGIVGGRFYLPAPSRDVLTTTGRLVGTVQTLLADNLDNMFNTLGGLAQPLRLGIYKRTTHAFVGAQSINVGNVFDSQRRRRNKLVETRVVRNVL